MLLLLPTMQDGPAVQITCIKSVLDKIRLAGRSCGLYKCVYVRGNYVDVATALYGCASTYVLKSETFVKVLPPLIGLRKSDAGTYGTFVSPIADGCPGIYLLVSLSSRWQLVQWCMQAVESVAPLLLVESHFLAEVLHCA
jgi:hypothetical protein